MEGLPQLTEEEKRRLLRLARATVEATARGLEPPEVTASLDYAPFGVFVTLKRKNGQLRGCIGTFRQAPLEVMVQEAALSAAFQDPRFPPVTAEELPDLTYEISILSPLEPVRSLEDIEVGRHGLVVERGWHRGLLLPQVATEWHWDRETFLQQTCLKAGLPPDCFLDPETRVYRFEALVFGEEDEGP